MEEVHAGVDQEHEDDGVDHDEHQTSMLERGQRKLKKTRQSD